MTTAWTEFAVDLYRTYRGSDRFYHDLNHIEECFDELKKIKSLVDDENALRLAIWYHDYFQDHKGDDEERSAEKAYSDVMQMGYQAPFAETIRRMILVTKHGVYLPITNDEQRICDIDLVPLAADNFSERSEWIRKEYPEVPHNAFILGRKAALKAFLDREHVYYTEPFRSLYEAAARRNLEAVVL